MEKILSNGQTLIINESQLDSTYKNLTDSQYVILWDGGIRVLDEETQGLIPRILNRYTSNSQPTKDNIEEVLTSNPFSKKDDGSFTSIYNDNLSVVVNNTNIIIINEDYNVNDVIDLASFPTVGHLISHIFQFIY
jgi:hypothetical protein